MYGMYKLVLGKRREERGGEREKKEKIQPAIVLRKGKEREKRKEKRKKVLEQTCFFTFLPFPFPLPSLRPYLYIYRKASKRKKKEIYLISSRCSFFSLFFLFFG